MHPNLWSRYSSWMNRMCYHQWYTSYQPQRAVLHISQTKLFSFYFLLFYFHLSMHITQNHLHLHQQPFQLSQTFVIAVLLRPTVSTYVPFLTTMVADSIKFSVFILFSYHFLPFNFYFQGISNRQVCCHTFHISGTTVYIVYYMHPMPFLFWFFLLFTFNFFIPVIQFFTNWIDR